MFIQCSHQSSVLLGDLSCISPIGLRQLRSAASARLSLGGLDGIVWDCMDTVGIKDSDLIIDQYTVKEIIDSRSEYTIDSCLSDHNSPSDQRWN